MPEVQDTPAAADAKPQTPFAAKLEEAFKAQEAKASEGEQQTAQPEKKEPLKKEAKPAEAAAPKSSTPRELFKPKVEAKEGETAATSAEPESAIDKITSPEFKDEKGKKGWDALKTEAKTWETKAKQLEREAAERKATGRDADALESKLAEREKTLKEYDEIVSRARLDDHPAFRKEFVDGRQKVIDRAKAIVEESDGDPKAIETALNLKGKARAEALREASTNLDSFQVARLGRAADELNDLDERAQAKRDAAKKSYDDLREQDRQREIEESATRSKRREVEFVEVSRRLSTQLEVLMHANGNAPWNERGQGILKDSLDYVRAHPESDIEAEILSRSAAAIRDDFIEADGKLQVAEKKVAELEAELKAIHSKSPSLAARVAGTPAGKGDGKRPFSEAIAQQMSGV